MQEFTKRERILFLMMRGWGNHQRSYKEIGLLFNETFWRGIRSADLNLQWSVL